MQNTVESSNLPITNIDRIDELTIVDYQELVTDLVAYLIDDPSSVEIHTTMTPAKIIFTLAVPADQKGKIIGKGGAIFKSLQALFSALARKGPRRFVELELLDDTEAPSPYYDDAEIDIPPSPLLKSYSQQIEKALTGNSEIVTSMEVQYRGAPPQNLLQARASLDSKLSSKAKPRKK